MTKEIHIFYCETLNHGVQHEETLPYSDNNLEYAERQFNWWKNCYLIKIRTVYENEMYSDEIAFNRDIHF